MGIGRSPDVHVETVLVLAVVGVISPGREADRTKLDMAAAAAASCFRN
jgi:hypothetical protein